MGETSGATLGIKEPGKSSQCPRSTLQTPLPQQSSSSVREEEDLWEVMEERRWRRIAFENLAKGMLRYFDNSNDVKVGITVLQGRVEVQLRLGIHIQQVAQQAMTKMAKRFSKYSGRKEKNYVLQW